MDEKKPRISRIPMLNRKQKQRESSKDNEAKDAKNYDLPLKNVSLKENIVTGDSMDIFSLKQLCFQLSSKKAFDERMKAIINQLKQHYADQFEQLSSFWSKLLSTDAATILAPLDSALDVLRTNIDSIQDLEHKCIEISDRSIDSHELTLSQLESRCFRALSFPYPLICLRLMEMLQRPNDLTSSSNFLNESTLSQRTSLSTTQLHFLLGQHSFPQPGLPRQSALTLINSITTLLSENQKCDAFSFEKLPFGSKDDFLSWIESLRRTLTPNTMFSLPAERNLISSVSFPMSPLLVPPTSSSSASTAFCNASSFSPEAFVTPQKKFSSESSFSSIDSSSSGKEEKLPKSFSLVFGEWEENIDRALSALMGKVVDLHEQLKKSPETSKRKLRNRKKGHQDEKSEELTESNDSCASSSCECSDDSDESFTSSSLRIPKSKSFSSTSSSSSSSSSSSTANSSSFHFKSSAQQISSDQFAALLNRVVEGVDLLGKRVESASKKLSSQKDKQKRRISHLQRQIEQERRKRSEVNKQKLAGYEASVQNEREDWVKERKQLLLAINQLSQQLNDSSKGKHIQEMKESTEETAGVGRQFEQKGTFEQNSTSNSASPQNVKVNDRICNVPKPEKQNKTKQITNKDSPLHSSLSSTAPTLSSSTSSSSSLSSHLSQTQPSIKPSHFTHFHSSASPSTSRSISNRRSTSSTRHLSQSPLPRHSSHSHRFSSCSSNLSHHSSEPGCSSAFASASPSASKSASPTSRYSSVSSAASQSDYSKSKNSSRNLLHQHRKHRHHHHLHHHSSHNHPHSKSSHRSSSHHSSHLKDTHRDSSLRKHDSHDTSLSSAQFASFAPSESLTPPNHVKRVPSLLSSAAVQSDAQSTDNTKLSRNSNVSSTDECKRSRESRRSKGSSKYSVVNSLSQTSTPVESNELSSAGQLNSSFVNASPMVNTMCMPSSSISPFAAYNPASNNKNLSFLASYPPPRSSSSSSSSSSSFISSPPKTITDILREKEMEEKNKREEEELNRRLQKTIKGATSEGEQEISEDSSIDFEMGNEDSIQSLSERSDKQEEHSKRKDKMDQSNQSNPSSLNVFGDSQQKKTEQNERKEAASTRYQTLLQEEERKRRSEGRSKERSAERQAKKPFSEPLNMRLQRENAEKGKIYPKTALITRSRGPFWRGRNKEKEAMSPNERKTVGKEFGSIGMRAEKDNRTAGRMHSSGNKVNSSAMKDSSLNSREQRRNAQNDRNDSQSLRIPSIASSIAEKPIFSPIVLPWEQKGSSSDKSERFVKSEDDNLDAKSEDQTNQHNSSSASASSFSTSKQAGTAGGVSILSHSFDNSDNSEQKEHPLQLNSLCSSSDPSRFASSSSSPHPSSSSSASASKPKENELNTLSSLSTHSLSSSSPLQKKPSVSFSSAASALSSPLVAQLIQQGMSPHRIHTHQHRHRVHHHHKTKDKEKKEELASSANSHSKEKEKNEKGKQSHHHHSNSRHHHRNHNHNRNSSSKHSRKPKEHHSRSASKHSSKHHHSHSRSRSHSTSHRPHRIHRSSLSHRSTSARSASSSACRTSMSISPTPSPSVSHSVSSHFPVHVPRAASSSHHSSLRSSHHSSSPSSLMADSPSPGRSTPPPRHSYRRHHAKHKHTSAASDEKSKNNAFNQNKRSKQNTTSNESRNKTAHNSYEASSPSRSPLSSYTPRTRGRAMNIREHKNSTDEQKLEATQQSFKTQTADSNLSSTRQVHFKLPDDDTKSQKNGMEGKYRRNRSVQSRSSSRSASESSSFRDEDPFSPSVK